MPQAGVTVVIDAAPQLDLDGKELSAVPDEQVHLCTGLSPVFTVIAASVQGAGTHEVLLVNTMAEDRLMVTNPGYGMNAYRVLNMSGQVVATGRLVNGTNTLDVGRLAPGAYVLAVEDGGTRNALRWVKL